jgi:hypothetical protein
MDADLDVSARAVVRITRVAPLFDRLAEGIIARLPYEDDGDVALDADDLAAIREKIDGLFPEFRRLYLSLLRKHLGAELPVVLAALEHEAVQRYFKAMQSMENELILELNRLGQKMVCAAGVEAA